MRLLLKGLLTFGEPWVLVDDAHAAPFMISCRKKERLSPKGGTVSDEVTLDKQSILRVLRVCSGGRYLHRAACLRSITFQ
ncbi:hypothetical protein EVAR_101922_1 [Eumeta japonica]|uniref:Uncharacterized protein n=1 Tax=Eumeta variegata TaxID=151549 RepID=A0A4C1TSV0_EUMVA|nr:hypothetical protein EVAR_101922_1 [Eumeta japonica]